MSVKTRKIVIEPVTRVEGHGKVTIQLDEQGEVTQARLHIVEFRGFERFIQGRPYWEVPVLVQRLCGICPVSHHLAAAKAMDGIVGVDQLTPTAEKIRRLMHYGHKKFPDLAVQGVMLRKFGQEVIQATAGKKIHGTGAVPGGVNKNISIEERDALLTDMDQMMEWSRGALKVARDYTEEHLADLANFGSFPSSHLSLIREDGAMDLYHGNLRAIDSEGETIFDQVDYQDYTDYIAEEVKSWTYMKFPFIRSLGPETGWYRVGPLARLNTCDFIDTPEAETARKEFMALSKGKPNNITMAYHWSRMIELLHSTEKIQELLNDPDLQGTDLMAKGDRREESVGLLEVRTTRSPWPI